MNTNMKELNLHISLTPEPPRRLFFISPPVFCETPGNEKKAGRFTARRLQCKFSVEY